MSANQPTPVLEVRHLRAQRGSKIILRDISWRVAPGEHWVILGPNGCGKTSLLKTLTAYLPPTSGEIRVFGQKFGETDWRELRKRIGLVTSALHSMIPDGEPALDTVISGKFAMLDLWGKISRRDRSQGLQILQEVNGKDLAERPWLYLSQGERQRVLVGRALMARPKLLILDEPCAGLDPVAREHFLQFIHHLAQKRGPALVLVTHHVEEIMPSFTHVLMLRAGEVVAAGAKSRVLTALNLENTFGVRFKLRRTRRRYTLEVAGH